MSQQWYAVYTRPKWEKKVAEHLTRKKIENYCPLNTVVRQWSDRKKVVSEPLFTSYVFLRIPKEDLSSIYRVDGVINLVHWLGRPAVIKDEEIVTIKEFLQEYSNIKLEHVHVSVSDRVRIINGPLSDYEGKVIAVQNKTIKVILPSLGYMMSAEIASSNVQILPSKTSVRNSSDPFSYSYS